MTVALDSNLAQIIKLTDKMSSGAVGPFDKDQQIAIKVVADNTRKLQDEKVLQLSLIGLSVKSHDLRQLLTGIVGYSALLNSPKLSSHGTLMRPQLDAIHRLHDLSRDVHWRLDGLILFANQIVRPREVRPGDMGMLNLGGYLRAQAEHYICRPYVQSVTIPAKLPNVYAHDGHTKLMLRGLFSMALEMAVEPQIHVSAYTMMKFVRVRIGVGDTAHRLEDLLALLKVEDIRGRDSRATQSMQMSVGRIQSTTLLELGMYVTTSLATAQGGRMKVESDGNRLVFTLTMPTEVPQAAL